jgi:hypothetical protein
MYAGNPVVEPGVFPDIVTFAAPFSDGVWYDSTDQLFKMWYWGGIGNFPPPRVSYSYSTDGKTWIKPQIPHASVPNTNMVIEAARDSSTVWMDVEDPDPSRRFKAFIYAGGQQLRVFFSSDGIQWEEQPFRIEATGDRTTMFWNPFRKVWVNSIRAGLSLPEISGRVRFYAESPDLINWTPADIVDAYWQGWDTFWTAADNEDPPYGGAGEPFPQLYNLDAVAYESLFVGLFSWFYPPPGPDLVEIGVGFSRDGFHWDRPTRGGGDNAFIPATNRPNTWNGYNSQSVGGCFLVVGDQLWFYFSGRETQHSIHTPAMSTGLAFLRRDGFASMDADESGGTLTTRPVIFSGSHLFVNVNNLDGLLNVEVLDLDGNIIAPYSVQNSIPIRADSTQRKVTWSGVDNLQPLAGTPVRFRFHLASGQLYSFWVSDSDSGASNGYLAAGGPGHNGLVDDLGSDYDKIAPTGSIVMPSDGESLSGVVTLQALASDNIRVKSVQFRLNGVSIGELRNEPYEVSFDTRAVENGSYTLDALVLDGADNPFVTDAVELTLANQGTVDTEAPVVSVVTPALNQEVAGSIQLSATATDEVGVTSVQFRLDGSEFGAQILAPPYNVSLDTTTLTNAAHTVTATARDLAGNVGTSTVVTFSVRNTPPEEPSDPVQGPDAVPPTVSITEPSSDGNVSGLVTITATADDNVAVAGVQFQINGVNVGAEKSVAPFNIQYDTTGLVDAIYIVTAVARDAAGNSTVSTPSYFVTDNLAGATPNQIFGTFVEAESGSRRDMVVLPDSEAFGGRYVYNRFLDRGSVTFRVNTPYAGKYVVWGRVQAQAESEDEFTLSVDGQPLGRFDTAQGSWSTGWRWQRVNDAINSGGLRPVVLDLASGWHTLVIGGKDPNARIDGFLLTNDLAFLPTDTTHIPPDEPPVVPNPQDDTELPVDTTAPTRTGSAPNGTLPAGTVSTNIALATDESSTCRYALSPGLVFTSMPNTFGLTGGTNHSSRINALQDGTSYSFYVRCSDAAGNANSADLLIRFAVAEVPEPTLQAIGQYLEAEGGARVHLVVHTDAQALGGRFVHLFNRDSGSVRFSARMPSADNYVIWGRVRSASGGDGKFQVSLDEGVTSTYNVGFGGASGVWRWVRVPVSEATPWQPRLFSLSDNTHSITFRIDDQNGDLDGILITNSLTFVPTDTHIIP